MITLTAALLPERASKVYPVKMIEENVKGLIKKV